MSLTSQLVTERVLRLIESQPMGADLPALRATILVSISPALEKFGRRIALGEHYRQLQKDFSVTPTAGVVDLTALTGILFDLKRSQVRVSSSNLILTGIDDYQSMQAGVLPADQVYYARNGTVLRFLNTDSSLTTYATAVKITANFVPVLADISSDMEGLFVETVAEVTLSQVERSSMKLKTDTIEQGQVGRA